MDSKYGDYKSVESVPVLAAILGSICKDVETRAAYAGIPVALPDISYLNSDVTADELKEKIGRCVVQLARLSIVKQVNEVPSAIGSVDTGHEARMISAREFIPEPVQTKNENEKGAFNMDFGGAFDIKNLFGEFGPITDGSVALTLGGKIAVRRKANEFVRYDAASESLENLFGMVIKDASDFMYIIPTAQVVVGDIIKAKESFYQIVGVTKNGGYRAVNIRTGAKTTMVKETNMFGCNFQNKVVCLFSNDNNTTTGGINPMLIMLLSDGKENDSMLPMLLLSQAGGSNNMFGGAAAGQQQTPFGGINPMMLMLMGGKGEGKGDMMKTMMMMSMMGGGAAGAGFQNMFSGAQAQVTGDTLKVDLEDDEDQIPVVDADEAAAVAEFRATFKKNKAAAARAEKKAAAAKAKEDAEAEGK